jgi:hypothetical protein
MTIGLLEFVYLMRLLVIPSRNDKTLRRSLGFGILMLGFYTYI